MNTYNVVSPALVLLQQAFDAPSGRRDHSRFIDEETGMPRWFAQHRRSVMEAALFAGRDKIGQVTEEELELREVRTSTAKLYSKGFFSKVRSWKGPDGNKYAWHEAEDGDLRLINTKSNELVTYVHYDADKGTRVVVSGVVLPFVELVLLTLIQEAFEAIKRGRKRQQAHEDEDPDLGVW